MESNKLKQEAQEPRRKKLVIFDVEGVILPKNRYLAFEVGQKLGLIKSIKLLLFGLLYEARLISLESALRKIYILLKGLNKIQLLDTFKAVPMLPSIEALFSKLKKNGYKIVIISSGLPQVIVESLAFRLKADYAFGLELEINNNVLTGNIDGVVIKKNGKRIAIDKLLAEGEYSTKDCIIVADDRNNAPIFYEEALKIGYNPDFQISFKSDFVIKENPMEIISIIEQTQKIPRYSITSNEVLREAIHVSSFLVTFIAMRLGNLLVALLLTLMTLTYTISELARIQRRNIPLLSQITFNAATPSERYEFTTTPIFFAFGIIVSLLFFPIPTNYASIAILTLGDGAASIFGKLLGKTRIFYNKGKNLEGTIAGFILAFLGASVFLPPLHAFVGAMIGLVVESLPLPINDNLSIPWTTGILLSFIS